MKNSLIILDNEEDSAKDKQIALRLLGRLHIGITFNTRDMNWYCVACRNLQKA